MMEDVARYYIEELIDRSLVKAEKIERGKVMTCKVHDLLRDVAIKKSKDVNFVHVYNDPVAQHSSTTCRREVVHHYINPYLSEKHRNKRMRSFLFFGESVDSLGAIYSKLKLLRVLDLGGVRLVCEGGKKSSPDVIGELIHLRYLGINDTFANNLQTFISNLRFLQTLDASENDSIRQTIDLRKLTSLRHVIGKFVGEMLIGNASNLQTLRSISSYSWSKLKHELLVNLRELTIFDSMWVDHKGVLLDLTSFSKLRSLRVLTLKVSTFRLSSSEKVVRFQTLVDLTLRCNISRLPENMGAMFPNLESLKLVGFCLEEDPMPALQKLQRLEELSLTNCNYSRGMIRINAKGFPMLRNLEMFMVRLDDLHIEEEAMPNLTKFNLTTKGKQTNLMVPDRLQVFLLN
ncbi:unnamed protein product [Cochlearia groenlandica]